MSGEEKDREYFGVTKYIVDSTVSGKAYPFWKTKEQLELASRWNDDYQKSEKIHVIEKSAYQKAVDALKEIYADGSYTDIAAEIATAALKELGELG